MANNKSTFQQPKFRINEQIHWKEVRIVGDGIESRVLPLSEARKIASEKELDLIEINPHAPTPIVKVASYDKMLYELKKAAKKNKQHAKPVKEIQLRVNIADHDLQTKERQATKFITEGCKVKVVVTMKGRELSRRKENQEPIFRFINDLDGIAVAETMPKDDGNKTIVILKKKG